MSIFEIIWRGLILLLFAGIAIINLIYGGWLVGFIFLFLTGIWLLSTLDSLSLQNYNKKK